LIGEQPSCFQESAKALGDPVEADITDYESVVHNAEA
jgi:hypothetical protein